MKTLPAEIETEIKNCIGSLRKGNVILFPGDAGWCYACPLDQTEKIRQILATAALDTSGILLPDISALIRFVAEIPETLESLVEFSNKPILFRIKNTINVEEHLKIEGRTAFRVASDLFSERLIRGFGKPVFFAIAGDETTAPAISEAILRSNTYVVNLRKPQASSSNNLVILDAGPGNLVRFIRK